MEIVYSGFGGSFLALLGVTNPLFRQANSPQCLLESLNEPNPKHQQKVQGQTRPPWRLLA